MGACQHESCNSRSSHHKEELFSTMNLCVKILKEKIQSFQEDKTSDKFIFLESVYSFINQIFRALLQGPKLSSDFYEKNKKKLETLTETLLKKTDINGQDPFNEEENQQKIKGSLKDIFEGMKQKEFCDFCLKDDDMISQELKQFLENKKQLIEGFSLIYAEKMWIDRFRDLREVEWKEFYNAFKEEFGTTLGEEINEEMMISLKSAVDINNTLKMDRYGWNEFYLKIYSDSYEMKSFLKNSILGSISLKNSIFLDYISTPSDPNMKDFYFKTPTTLEISEEGVLSPKEFKIKRNLREKGLVFGRDNTEAEGDVLFNKNLKEISKNHFKIIAKYILDESTASFYKTEFFLNSLSLENKVSFVVEEKGYVLCNNSVICLKNDVCILVKSVIPSFSPTKPDKYFYVDSNVERRNLPKRGGNFGNPSIILSVKINKDEKETKEKTFKVYNNSSDFQITIGNAYSNDFTIPKADSEHLSINYCAKDQCWFVADRMKEASTHRTFLMPFEKGVQLSHGMKFNMEGHIFEVRELI